MLSLFICPGCRLPSSWSVICHDCKSAIRFNRRLLDSPAAHIEAIAPLLYSLGTTHSVFKAWKSNPGLLPQRLIFKIHPDLRKALFRIEANAVIPIPQSAFRSWKRGHASALSASELFCKNLFLPLVEALTLTGDESQMIHRKQAHLLAQERDFAPNPFFIKGSVRGLKTVLLVDDLITTGNTLARAAETLKAHSPNLRIYAASIGYRPAHLLKEKNPEPAILLQAQDSIKM